MPRSKNDSGVRQLKNGFWAYRFSISVSGRAINQRGSTDLDGNILRTKQEAIRARKKAIKLAQLAPLLPPTKPEPVKKTMRDVFAAAHAAGFHFVNETMLTNNFATPTIFVTERCDRSARLISAII